MAANEKKVSNLIKRFFPKLHPQLPTIQQNLKDLRASFKSKKEKFVFRKPIHKFKLLQKVREDFPELSQDVLKIVNNFTPSLISISKETVLKEFEDYVLANLADRPMNRWLATQVAEFEQILQKLQQQDLTLVIKQSTQSWTTTMGPYLSVQRVFRRIGRVQLCLADWPSTFTGQTALDFFRKTSLVPFGFGNSPYTKLIWLKAMGHIDSICIDQESAYFNMGYVEHIELWEKSAHRRAPCSYIILKNPIIFLYKSDLNVIDTAPFTTVIFCVNLQFPTFEVDNNVLGYFETEVEIPAQPHINQVYLPADEADLEDLANWVPQINDYVAKATEIEDRFTNTYTGGFDLPLAVNNHLEVMRTGAIVPLKIQNVTKYLKVPHHYPLKQDIPFEALQRDKNLLTYLDRNNPWKRRTCPICNKLGHSPDNCFLRKLRYIDLGYQNITFELAYNIIHRFPDYHYDIPLVQTEKWLLEEFVPPILAREQHCMAFFYAQISQLGGKPEVIADFAANGNRPTVHGIFAAAALGMSKPGLLRFFFGNPRDPAPAKPYRVIQNHTQEEIDGARAILEDKLKDGSYAVGPETAGAYSVAWFYVSEQGKNRLILWPQVDNARPKSNFSCPTPLVQFLSLLNSFAVTVDIKSCYDSVRVLDKDLKVYIDVGGKFFFPLGFITGATDSPIKNEVAHDEALSLAAMFVPAKPRFIDDLRWGFGQDPALALLQANVAGLLLTKMGIPISPKLPYDLSTTSIFLGTKFNTYLRSLRSKDDHFVKLQMFVMHLLLKGPKTTVRDIMVLEGKLRSMIYEGYNVKLSEVSLFLAKLADAMGIYDSGDYTLYLSFEIGLTKGLIKALRRLLNNVLTFLHNNRTLAGPNYDLDVFIVTDAGDTQGAGFIIITGRDMNLAHLKDLFLPIVIPLPEELHKDSSTKREQFTLLSYVKLCSEFFERLRQLTITPHVIILNDNQTLVNRLNTLKAPSLEQLTEIKQIILQATEWDPEMQVRWQPRESDAIRIADVLPKSSEVYFQSGFVKKLKRHFKCNSFYSPFDSLAYKNISPSAHHLRWPRQRYLRANQIVMICPNPRITRPKDYLNTLLFLIYRGAKCIFIFPRLEMFQPLMNYVSNPYFFEWSLSNVIHANKRQRRFLKKNLKMVAGLTNFELLMSKKYNTLINELETSYKTWDPAALTQAF